MSPRKKKSPKKRRSPRTNRSKTSMGPKRRDSLKKLPRMLTKRDIDGKVRVINEEEKSNPNEFRRDGIASQRRLSRIVVGKQVNLSGTSSLAL